MAAPSADFADFNFTDTTSMTTNKESDVSSSESLGSKTPQSSIEASTADVASLDIVNDSSYIMVVGGLGYIGSHTTLELLKEGYNVVVVDNLSNSFEATLAPITTLAQEYCSQHGRAMPKLNFHKADYRSSDMRNVLETYRHENTQLSKITGLIHFAAYKSVEESISKPLAYYQNNVCGLVDFLITLQEFNIRNFVFSSSATVYGVKASAGKPLKEGDLIHHPEKVIDANGKETEIVPGAMGHLSPYGKSKFFSEAILADVALVDPEWTITALRYFNPVGCHESGILGEDPRQIPTNLFPVITQVLTGARPHLSIFGSDWDTRDGTAMRDFIHVVDLARGHIRAVAAASKGDIKGFRSFNLGTGNGSTVAECVAAIDRATGKKLPVKMAGRRAGDVGSCVAATGRVNEELGWKTEKSLDDCARDTWNFICKSGAVKTSI